MVGFFFVTIVFKTDSHVAVRARAGCPKNMQFGFRNNGSQLTGVEKDSWAAKWTDLDLYVGSKIHQINGMSFSNAFDYQILVPGQDVIFIMEIGELVQFSCRNQIFMINLCSPIVIFLKVFFENVKISSGSDKEGNDQKNAYSSRN